ncbi:hypothetical protein B7982_06435 [Fibrobacter sp. UWB2]|uniref:hypothetical protein n=1 Tax=Fibrobacter sp. UWB2 TaxID=1964358 RepID=UPI000B520333|nr:hypothetical protein [Fibrobacter sp. UWB2]OWV23117.1 hypothetical protein B7982_06435 [Fibrobacter sp. UWB2]
MSDVFVIGAGCSVLYGFPTGTMLMQKLKNFDYGRKFPRDPNDSIDIFLVDLYQEHFGYSSTDNKRQYGKDYAWVLPYTEHENFYNQLMDGIVLPFSQSIRHSMMVSTDEFLKNRLSQEKSNEADFGKRLIAYEILKAEQASRLGNIDWIQHLLSRIDQQSNWDEILKQTVFLTFNYDRVLEYCIFLYLTSDKQYADADAHAFIKEMQIHHVNGFIGSLEEIPFGAVENGKYQEIAKRMATVWEKRSNRGESEIGMYQGFLKNAQRVYFMGFSYIPDNLESIGIDRGAIIIREAKVYATAMGLSPQNRLRISTYLDLKDFEKRNEPEPMLEIVIRRAPFMTDFQYQQEYKQKEKIAKEQIRSKRIRYENRILKDASAVDLILDYYTLP